MRDFITRVASHYTPETIFIILGVLVAMLVVYIIASGTMYKASEVQSFRSQERSYEITRDNVGQIVEHQILKAMGVEGYEKDHPFYSTRRAEIELGTGEG